MSVKITPADEKIEFLDNSGNIDAKISLDGSGNLKLENFNGGSMVLGDATADIYVGDGSASVDIVYDVGGRLYSTANQHLTIGKSSLGGNDIVIDSPNWSVTDAGLLSLGGSTSTDATLNLTAGNTDGSPASRVHINMAGNEGRAMGTWFTDSTYNGEEWFAGMQYSGAFNLYNIGYDASGGQAEYLANAILSVNADGYVTMKEGKIIDTGDSGAVGLTLQNSEGSIYLYTNGDDLIFKNVDDNTFPFNMLNGSVNNTLVMDSIGITVKPAIANATIRVQADTDSSPSPRIEMMRGAHDTWGSGDNYTDWRIENSNDLVFYSGFSSQSSGAAVERLRIHSDSDGITINNAYKLPALDGTVDEILKTDGADVIRFSSKFNGYAQFFFQGDNVSNTANYNFNVLGANASSSSINSYGMPVAGVVKAMTIRNAGGGTITSTTNGATFAVRVNGASSGDDYSTVVLDGDNMQRAFGSGSAYAVATLDFNQAFVAGDAIQVRRVSGDITFEEVLITLWVDFT